MNWKRIGKEILGQQRNLRSEFAFGISSFSSKSEGILFAKREKNHRVTKSIE